MCELTFQRRHDYSRSVEGIEIPISLRTDSAGPVRLPAKVDTGATCCIFQRDYAEQLGIEVECGEYREFQTATGVFRAYGHTVKLACLDWEFESIVYFAENAAFSRNVVGRNGWLQHFRLALIDHDLTLYMSHYND